MLRLRQPCANGQRRRRCPVDGNRIGIDLFVDVAAIRCRAGAAALLPQRPRLPRAVQSR
ncbi:hypothetical protein ACFOPN_09200 [Xanthomonas hyacinthi]|uniref:hypothetical protein n=1 Tax=Xanthomonas hyacinthi TaxID=56455 RepID=UPI001303C52D|nr:hypothetical protein [Xanthomonas hyacinthi]